jgi:hypothetical protein
VQWNDAEKITYRHGGDSLIGDWTIRRFDNSEALSVISSDKNKVGGYQAVITVACRNFSVDGLRRILRLVVHSCVSGAVLCLLVRYWYEWKSDPPRSNESINQSNTHTTLI